MSVVLKRTVGDSDWRFDNLSGGHLQSQSNIPDTPGLKPFTIQFICTLLPEMMCKMLVIFILRLILGLAFQKKKNGPVGGDYGTIQNGGILLRFHYIGAQN